jgi:hypothetical protein
MPSAALTSEQHGRLGDDRAGDGDALALPTGHLRRKLVRHVLDAEARQPVARDAHGLSPARAGQQQRQRHVLRGRHLGDQLPELKQHPELAAAQPRAHGLALVVDAPSREVDLARVGAQHAGQAQQQRRLARSGGTRHGEDLAAAELDRYAAQGGGAAVALDQRASRQTVSSGTSGPRAGEGVVIGLGTS